MDKIRLPPPPPGVLGNWLLWNPVNKTINLIKAVKTRIDYLIDHLIRVL